MGWDRAEVAVKGAGSLLWVDGVLYDVAKGWRRIGGIEDGQMTWGPFGEFDTATLAPAGDLAALVDSDGTKVLLLEPGGSVVRELDRSWYCASAYRYPLVLFTLPDGRTAVAHCPDHYNRIEIEVAATGERLTLRPDRQAADVFHSRLQVSADGTRLLSAGWVWHPLGVATVSSLTSALEDPAALDRDGLTSDPDDRFSRSIDAEVAGACFLGNDIIVATSEEDLGNGGPLGPLMLARWSHDEECYTWQRPAPTDLGDLVSFHGSVLALNGHPRLFDGQSGELSAEWPELQVPPTQGPLFLNHRPGAGSSMVAVDAKVPRFAIAEPDRVTVITRTAD